MENNARKFNWKLAAAIGCGALVLLVLLAVLLWPSNIVDELTVEAGREVITANEFRKADKGIDAAFVSDLSTVDLNTIGTYSVSIEY